MPFGRTNRENVRVYLREDNPLWLASRVFGPCSEAVASMRHGPRPEVKFPYQTRQEFAGYIGWPLVQPKALPNWSKFCTVPLTRQRPGEWGSTSADWRAACSVWFWHHTCAKPRK